MNSILAPITSLEVFLSWIYQLLFCEIIFGMLDLNFENFEIKHLIIDHLHKEFLKSFNLMEKILKLRVRHTIKLKMIE